MRIKRGGNPQARDEGSAFREAMSDVVPLPPANRVEPFRMRAQPRARERVREEDAMLQELARAGQPAHGRVELEDDSSYLRTGLPRDVLRKLRRAHWSIEDELDLHGHTGDEAAALTAAFIGAAREAGMRCVRIIHGKGMRSPGREPVLRRRVRELLAARPDVLAFVEPRAAHGGSGAVVVLLNG